MSIFAKPFDQAQRERKRLAELSVHLSGMVGKTFVYRGPADDDRTSNRLYPERIGRRCTVLSISSDRVRSPLVIAFEDHFRGIAEPGHLLPFEKAEVA